jgi:adenosine deaminase
VGGEDEAGVLVTLNADDPLMFGANVLDEYGLARSAFGLGDDTMAAIAATSVEAGGAPKDVKDAALSGIDEWLRS